jgi:hypothetical protein
MSMQRKKSFINLQMLTDKLSPLLNDGSNDGIPFLLFKLALLRASEIKYFLMLFPAYAYFQSDSGMNELSQHLQSSQAT